MYLAHKPSIYYSQPMAIAADVFAIYLHHEESDALLFLSITGTTLEQVELPGEALKLLKTKTCLAKVPANKKMERKKKHPSYEAALKAAFRLIDKKCKEGFQELDLKKTGRSVRLEKGNRFYESADFGIYRVTRHGTVGKEGTLTREQRPNDFCLFTLEKDIKSKTREGYEEVAVAPYPLEADAPLADYLTRFKAMVAELVKHKEIEVTYCHTPAPASYIEIEAAQRYLAAQKLPPLTEELLTFYTQANGLQLQWKLLNPEDYPESMARTEAHGSVNILPIQELFSNRVQRGSLGQGDLAKQFGFDELVEDDCVTLDLSDETVTKVCLYDEESHPLGLTVTAYLELLLKTRGFLRWPWNTEGTTYPHANTTDFNTTMKKLFRG